MGYFQVRYDSRVVNYDRKLFIRFATGSNTKLLCPTFDEFQNGLV